VLEFDGAIKRYGPLVALDECTFAARPGRLTGGTKDVGVTGRAPAALAATIHQQARSAGITAQVHRYAILAAGEQAVRRGRVHRGDSANGQAVDSPHRSSRRPPLRAAVFLRTG
jgi:hypothetical protein